MSTLIAWNLNHRARRRKIPAWIATALAAQQPDVVVLTEYVVGLDHERFVRELGALGLRAVRWSASVAGENQVLIAARESLESGWLVAPPLAPSLPSNLLHVRLESGLHVVGFRMPAFKQAHIKRECWAWLREALRALVDESALLVGDINTAPGDRASTGGAIFEQLRADGWTHALPSEGYSYRDSRSGSERRIDHLFHTGRVECRESRYDWTFQELGSAAASGVTGLPDHAMLVARLT